MLQKYKAISLEKSSMLGGTTLPCMMLVSNDSEDIASYVVKVFGQQHIKQYNPTNKEIFGNYIAEMFDLKVPKMAVIQVSDNIIEEMKKQETYENSNLAAGLYFGCELIANADGYNPDIEYCIDESALIFAFDVLIRNFDRREQKPNILFKDDRFILIDHDLSLDIQRSYEDYNDLSRYKQIVDGTKGKHIFFNRLREKKEQVTFDEFIEYLKYLDFNELEQLKSKMIEFGLNTADIENIILYLRAVQQNAANFQQLLNNLLK